MNHGREQELLAEIASLRAQLEAKESKTFINGYNPFNPAKMKSFWKKVKVGILAFAAYAVWAFWVFSTIPVEDMELTFERTCEAGGGFANYHDGELVCTKIRSSGGMLHLPDDFDII